MQNGYLDVIIANLFYNPIGRQDKADQERAINNNSSSTGMGPGSNNCLKMRTKDKRRQKQQVC